MQPSETNPIVLSTPAPSDALNVCTNTVQFVEPAPFAATIFGPALLFALESLARVVPSKSPKPILTTVLLQCDPSRGLVSVRGTDLETYAEASTLRAEFQGGSPFAACVEFSRLHRFIKGARRLASVALSALPTGLRVSVEGGASLDLPTSDSAEFPNFPSDAAANRVTLYAADLRRMLSSALSAAAKEQGRYSMHGVSLEFDAPRCDLVAVATDGRRLVVASPLRPINAPSVASFSGILPRGTARALLATLPKKGEALATVSTIGADAKGRAPFLLFSLSGFDVYSRALDGEFPRYRAVIPTESTTSVSLNVDDATETVESVALASGDETRAVSFSLPHGFAHVQVESIGTAAKARASLDLSEIKVADRRNPSVTLNADYFVDALKALGADRVSMRWTQRNAPVRFDADGALAVVMPITIDA